MKQPIFFPLPKYRYSVGLLVVIVIGACGTSENEPADTSTPRHPDAVFIDAAAVSFDEIIPEVAEFGTVFGDRETGAHGTFVRLKKGQGTPAHTHGAAYDGVVLAGILENPIPGLAASEQGLPRGSYYHVPRLAEHITRCADDSPTDCLTFFYQDTAFDFDPDVTSADPDAASQGIFLPSSDLSFETILPDIAEFATAYGNRDTTRHGTFVRIKKGEGTPPHTHGTEYHGVILEGIVENPTPSNEPNPAALGLGSYYFVPANAEHVTRCAKDSPTDCLTFFFQDAAFDFFPIEDAP